MTNAQWRAELQRAIRELGAHWRVNKAAVEQVSPICYAEVSDTKAGKSRKVSVARDRFQTEAARLAEITRQIKAASDSRSETRW
jgi:hypothetical protein